ncbi:ester cyclase, partial [Phenylobacterium sp.]|uniref:ester cyclase n=1 Tax=Phenylobacterium sp. TaxID=1871053 RepID=UPI002810B74A
GFAAARGPGGPTDDVVLGVVGEGGQHARDVVAHLEAARGFYEALFADLAEGQVRCLRRLYGEDFLVDDSVWRGKAVGRPFGLEGRGRDLEFRLLHVVEFSESGEMKRENVWIDLASILQQLPQD